MSIVKTTITDPSISSEKSFDAFVLQTKNSTYAFDVINGFVNNSYWGKRIERTEDIPLSVCPIWNSRGREEYPFFGGKFFHNEALKVTFPDNVRDTILKYEDFEINPENTRLIITLKDEVYPLRVKLYYDVFEELDIIDRYAEIINDGSDDIMLETFYSAGITLPRKEKSRLTYMGSGNVSEYRVKQCDIGPDTICVEAKAGISTFTNIPYFAIDDYTATEHSGDVRYGALQWSGNWQIKISNYKNTTKVVGGISNFDCNVNLKGGESFKTPIFTIGFSDEGFGKCGRMLHDYQRTTTLCPHINAPMPVLYNAWSTFQFNIDEKLLFEQAQRCADLGIELFVIDDGWMIGRNNEKGGLGDWIIDPKKFPHGLQYVIDKINAMGMKFGIWIEPEMVTEDSNLYKEHPDWILHYPTR
jgi:alpha-galactosidase